MCCPSSDSKFGLINYLIFLCTEDYFMAKVIRNMVDLQVPNEVVNIMPFIWDTTPIRDTKVLADKFILNNWKCIPDLLSPEYKFR